MFNLFALVMFLVVSPRLWRCFTHLNQTFDGKMLSQGEVYCTWLGRLWRRAYYISSAIDFASVGLAVGFYSKLMFGPIAESSDCQVNILGETLSLISYLLGKILEPEAM